MEYEEEESDGFYLKVHISEEDKRHFLELFKYSNYYNEANEVLERITAQEDAEIMPVGVGVDYIKRLMIIELIKQYS